MGKSADGGEGSPVRAVVFDKDGTLVDFERTWNAGYRASAAAVAAMPGCQCDSRELLRMGGMDIDSGRVEQDSLLSESTAPEIANVWSHKCFEVRPPWVERQASGETTEAAGKTERALCEILEGIWASTLRFTVSPLGDVAAVLTRLHGEGIKLACVTNDTEAQARAQLGGLGVAHLFGAVIGYDSGHGSKPGPGGVLSACQQLGVPPGEALIGRRLPRQHGRGAPREGERERSDSDDASPQHAPRLIRAWRARTERCRVPGSFCGWTARMASRRRGRPAR